MAAKPVLQASDTLLGLGKDGANDVRSLFRAGITRHTKSFQFLDVLRVGPWVSSVARHSVYTTNAVDAVHRQFRKLTKTKGGLPNENSLLKLLYAGILKASERWTHPIKNWNLTLSQLTIHFPGRLDDYISL